MVEAEALPRIANFEPGPDDAEYLMLTALERGEKAPPGWWHN
jgi:hypothetical protein